MSLDQDAVARIAELASLAIETDATAAYARDLSNILDFVGRLEAVDTSEVTPLAHPQDAVQRLRDDTVSETVERDTFQQLAPLTEAGLYLVPKVID